MYVPQQRRPPAVVTAHVAQFPAEIDAAFVRPETGTGVVLFVVELFPSSPQELSPQHCTRPVLRSPHACSAPTEMFVSFEHALCQQK
jgi:hypothetical protein